MPQCKHAPSRQVDGESRRGDGVRPRLWFFWNFLSMAAMTVCISLSWDERFPSASGASGAISFSASGCRPAWTKDVADPAPGLERIGARHGCGLDGIDVDDVVAVVHAPAPFDAGSDCSRSRTLRILRCLSAEERLAGHDQPNNSATSIS